MAKRRKRAARKAPRRSVSKTSMGASCAPGGGKCMGWLLLIVGVLLLLRDLGQWDFWNLQGWTLLFLILGLWKLCKGYKS